MKKELKENESSFIVNCSISKIFLHFVIYAIFITVILMICLYYGLKNLDQVIDFLTLMRNGILSNESKITIGRVLLIIFPNVLILANITSFVLFIDIYSDSRKNK